MELSKDKNHMASPRIGPAPDDVRRAIVYMRGNPGGRVSMVDLVTRCGVAGRTLRKHFRAFVGVSPLEYWRRLRLAAAREELLRSLDGASITAVATRHGFNHFGRFSSAYRRCFGELPSATMRRGRAAGGTRARRAVGKDGVHSDDAHDTPPAVRLSRGKPSLVVLPCETSAAEPRQRFFAQCVAEGIAAALSRVRSVSVQVPTSSQRAGCLDPRRLAAERGARYVLTGRLAQSGERLRMIIRLLDTATTDHIWADTYDGGTGDPFGLQDRATDGVVRALLPAIRGAEIERVRRKRPEDLDAYELTMRALPFVLASNPGAVGRALDLLHRAIEIDPDYALSTALAAWCHAQLVVHNGTSSPLEERRLALQLAERASILDPDDPQVLTARCAVHTVAGQFDVAGTLIARALARDPTSGWAWERSGWLKTFAGEPALGIAHFSRAMQLDPSCPSNANRFVGFGCAHFDAGRYDQAASWMRHALREQPATVWVNRTLSVSYVRLGERLAAIDSLAALQRYCPDLTIGQVMASLPFTPDFMERVAEGLSDLGLPP